MVRTRSEEGVRTSCSTDVVSWVTVFPNCSRYISDWELSQSRKCLPGHSPRKRPSGAAIGRDATGSNAVNACCDVLCVPRRHLAHPAHRSRYSLDARRDVARLETCLTNTSLLLQSRTNERTSKKPIKVLLHNINRRPQYQQLTSPPPVPGAHHRAGRTDTAPADDDTSSKLAQLQELGAPRAQGIRADAEFQGQKKRSSEVTEVQSMTQPSSNRHRDSRHYVGNRGRDRRHAHAPVSAPVPIVSSARLLRFRSAECPVSGIVRRAIYVWVMGARLLDRVTGPGAKAYWVHAAARRGALPRIGLRCE